MSLVFSVSVPIELFAPFNVNVRRHLKDLWAMLGQHWDKEVEPGEEAKFLK